LPRAPIDAKWSKFQLWSNPASSAIRQTVRISTTVVNCGASFSPMRTSFTPEPYAPERRGGR
jgi:hypothetical protein